MLKIQAKENKCIDLGRRGEDSARVILFDISGWAELYGQGEARLIAKRDHDLDSYPVEITQDNTTVSWVVKPVDNDQPGYGNCELVYITDGSIVKSVIYQTHTDMSLSDPVSPPNSPSTFGSLEKKMGSLDDLETEDKSSLVSAINEVKKTGGSPSGGVSSWNDLKDRPFYAEEEVGELFDLIAAGASWEDQGGGIFVTQLETTLALTVGESYEIVINGTTYKGVGQENAAVFGSGVVAVGDMDAYTTGDITNFAYMLATESGIAVAVCKTDVVPTEFKVLGKKRTVVPIPNEYIDGEFLPETAEEGQVLAYLNGAWGGTSNASKWELIEEYIPDGNSTKQFIIRKNYRELLFVFHGLQVETSVENELHSIAVNEFKSGVGSRSCLGTIAGLIVSSSSSTNDCRTAFMHIAKIPGSSMGAIVKWSNRLLTNSERWNSADFITLDVVTAYSRFSFIVKDEKNPVRMTVATDKKLVSGKGYISLFGIPEIGPTLESRPVE